MENKKKYVKPEAKLITFEDDINTLLSVLNSEPGPVTEEEKEENE